ncbi:MAG: DUF1992 domain-containing protein [Nocardioidaceae bacterium]
MHPDRWSELGSPPGQCEACAHAKLNLTRRGTAYLRCLKAAEDARLARYPRLPVRDCPGFEPTRGEHAPTDPSGAAGPKDENAEARDRRADQQALWVDQQVRQAMRRGEFDNLPGAGKPLKLSDTHDPDWWVKRLIERENISGLAPPAIALRREDATLEATLDEEPTADDVRRVVSDFNARVIEARRQLLGGPPVVTATRDVEAEVEAWRARRASRRASRPSDARPERRGRRGWFRRHTG